MALQLLPPLTYGCTAQAPQDPGPGRELARVREALAAAQARNVVLEQQVWQRDAQLLQQDAQLRQQGAQLLQ